MLSHLTMPRLAMPDIKATRRGFLLGSAAVAGGLAIGFRPAFAAGDGAAASNPFDAYLTISPDHRVTVISSQFDMGQGAYHGVATLVVEELGARWDQVDVTGGYGNIKQLGNLAMGGAAQMTGGLDADGKIVAWEQHIVGQSIFKGTPMEGMIQNGVDPLSVEGAANLHYAFPNQTVGLTSPDAGVPVLWWRSVASTHTAFSVETFLDEWPKRRVPIRSNTGSNCSRRLPAMQG